MQKRELGSTGLMVSPIGLGTVKLGRDQGVKYPEAFRIPDDRAAGELIAQASALGINLIDTAPAYGNSEERLGFLLQGQRKDWVICSKVGEEFDHGESHFDFSARHTRLSIERSLKRLHTDYIDMVLIHSDGRDCEILRQEGVLQELQRCQQEGLIRAIGMSTKTLEGGLLAAELADVVMLTYNPAHTEEEPVLDYCAEHRRGALIKKALGSGHLARSGEDPVQQAMDFIFTHPGVGAAIIGTINPKHLQHNLEAVEKALQRQR